MSRGKRESSWLVMRRCWAMVLRLQRGPATKQQLIEFVEELVPEAYGEAAGQKGKKFERDKAQLADELQIFIEYNSEVKGYMLVEARWPWLDLADEYLESLAFLANTFKEGSPNYGSIQRLLGQVVSLLPAGSKRRYDSFLRQTPETYLRSRDKNDIDPMVWAIVLEAWQAKQELIFDYLSGTHEDQIPRQHHVQPWDLQFSERGRYMLKGYCLFNDGPNGPWTPNDYIYYRVSHIVPNSVKILPQKLPGIPPRGKPKKVVYELSPRITRFGISEQQRLLTPYQVFDAEDGWVRVEGQAYDIFDLARTLLYYGGNCRVLGDKELLQEMKSLTQELYAIYGF